MRATPGPSLLLVQHFISSGHSQGSVLRRLPVNARELSDSDIQQLIRFANEYPTPDIYMRISRTYEVRGDYRKALQFLRRAEKLSQIQDSSE